MAKLTWDEHLNVGVAAMDKQHQVILDRISAISSALEEAAPRSECLGMLEDLDIYCKMHFFDEERLMNVVNYAALAHHQRQHDLFVTNLEQYLDQEQQGLYGIMAIHVMFVSHIIREDLPYGVFMRNHPRLKGTRHGR